MIGVVTSRMFGERHPGYSYENPSRISAILNLLEREGILESESLEVLEPRRATRDEILRVHSLDYISHLESMSSRGWGYLSPDTPVYGDTFDLAMLAAGGCLLALEMIEEGRWTRAFALIRPPGHHAGVSFGGGFCYLNNVAIAASKALNSFRRLAIVDIDLHHGNGTYDIFEMNERVLYVSLHQRPSYPGTGNIWECGSGDAEGTKINIPLYPGTTDETYLLFLDRLVEPIVEDFSPDLILVSAGYDIYFADPLGGMRITMRGIARIYERLINLSNSLTGGRILLVLEGGYDRLGLPYGVLSTLKLMMEQDGSESVVEPRDASGISREVNDWALDLLSEYTKFFSEYWNIRG